MKKIKWALTVTVLAILMITCKKDEDLPEITEYPPQITSVGNLIEEMGYGMIGPDGGSVNSTDGKIELVFPAGTLTTMTEISIQSVTNNAPGGIGTAYRFGPAETVPGGPVTLKFHYNEDDVAGSLPMFLGLAVQKEDGMWYPYRHQEIDTIEKTITVTSNDLFSGSSKSAKDKSSNFLDHATFLDLYIFPKAAELKISQTQGFQVFAVENHAVENGDDMEYLPPLPVNHEVSPTTVKEWLVNGRKNGDAEYGTVVPNGSACTYTAPGAVPSRNPVDLEAELKLWYRDPETGKDFNNLKINAPITIIEEQHKYELKLEYTQEDYSTWAFDDWKLVDKVIMDVLVRNGIVTVNNIRNEEGVITPTTQTKVHIPGVYTCTATVEEYRAGSLNITEGSGTVLFNDLDPNSPWLNLTIINNFWAWPKIMSICNHNGEIEGPAYLGGEISDNPIQYYFRFVLTNEIQTKDESYIKTTLTPKSLLPE